MFLRRISLSLFKNYEEAQFVFSPAVNCIVGENGTGKTNLLDAIHYLALSKSALNAVDTQNIKHGNPYFVIQGDFERDEKNFNVLCGVQTGQKKTLKVDKVAYERISDHIGQFPIVLIAPQDQALILEGSEERRRFFDTVISQIDHTYLLDLMQYNHLLKQRNQLLKQAAERNQLDQDLLATYNMSILPIAYRIFNRRTQFVADFMPYFRIHYEYLTEQREHADMRYSSDVAEADFEQRFKAAWQRDLAMQRTTLGIHRDDFEFEIEGYALKKYGSQGQQKSFLIALKLAQFDVIRKAKGMKPLLLLDDIFDKLDERRMNKLIEMVAQQTFGQIFITDARPERSQSILKNVTVEKSFFRLGEDT